MLLLFFVIVIIVVIVVVVFDVVFCFGQFNYNDRLELVIKDNSNGAPPGVRILDVGGVGVVSHKLYVI